MVKALASISFGLALGLTLAGSAAAECKFVKIGDVPVTMRGLRPIVQMTINGQKASMLLDTGAFFSTLFANGVERLKLETVAEDRVRVVGIGGEADVRLARVKDAQIGDFRVGGAEFLTLRQNRESEIDGIIGQNFFSRLDVEYDLGHGMVRVFSSEGCEKAMLAYWSPEGAADTNLEGPLLQTNKLAALVTVNGKRVVAQFDTGAPRSILSSAFAKTAGIDTAASDAESLGPIGGIGARSTEAWSAPFKTFSIGGETISNSRITVAHLEANVPFQGQTDSRIAKRIVDFPEMFLGADFFRAHRIYLARNQRRIYFTYNGGAVFELSKAPTAP